MPPEPWTTTPLTTSTSTITSSVTTSTSTTTTTTPLTTSTGGKGNGKGNGNGNASTPHTVNSSPVLQVSAGPARPGENDETAPEPDGSLVNPPTLLPPQQADSRHGTTGGKGNGKGNGIIHMAGK